MAKTTSYKKKDGSRWYRIIGYLGTDPQTGKQIYFRRSGFKSELSAVRAYEKAVSDIQKNGFQSNKTITFEQVYRLWLEAYKSTIKESSYVKLTQKFNRHILPIFGNQRINKIDTFEVQQFANQMQKTVLEYKEYISNVSRIFKFAIRNKLVNDNPVTRIDIPKPRKKGYGSKNKNYFDAKQLNLFLNVAKKNMSLEIYALFHLMAHTGCRTGEALGLQYGDIDSKNNLTISRTLARGERRRLYFENPKTANSHRMIPLDKETISILNKWHSLQKRILKSSDLAVEDKQQLIFTNYTGDFIDLFYPRLWMHKICKQAKLPMLSPHALRHTFATLLLSEGSNYKVISELLGHASVAFTMDIYAGVYQKDTKDTLEKFNQIINLWKFLT